MSALCAAEQVSDPENYESLRRYYFEQEVRKNEDIPTGMEMRLRQRTHPPRMDSKVSLYVALSCWKNMALTRRYIGFYDTSKPMSTAKHLILRTLLKDSRGS